MYVAIGEEKLTIWEYLLYMVYMIPLSLSSPLLSFFHSFEYMLGDILNPDLGLIITTIITCLLLCLSFPFFAFDDEVVREFKGAYNSSNVIRKIAAAGVLYTLLMYSYNFCNHCVMMAASLSNPSIMIMARKPNGERFLIDDFREAYWWLRDKTPEDSRRAGGTTATRSTASRTARPSPTGTPGTTSTSRCSARRSSRRCRRPTRS